MEFLQVGSFLPLIKNMQAAVESAKENDETIESFLANFFQKKKKKEIAIISLL
jgi:hypothetical protein